MERCPPPVSGPTPASEEFCAVGHPPHKKQIQNRKFKSELSNSQDCAERETDRSAAGQDVEPPGRSRAAGDDLGFSHPGQPLAELTPAHSSRVLVPALPFPSSDRSDRGTGVCSPKGIHARVFLAAAPPSAAAAAATCPPAEGWVNEFAPLTE